MLQPAPNDCPGERPLDTHWDRGNSQAVAQGSLFQQSPIQTKKYRHHNHQEGVNTDSPAPRPPCPHHYFV